MTTNMRRRRQVDLSNYADNEGVCACGCGLALNDELMIACQALCQILSRRNGGGVVQHRISSGARCKAKNDATQGAARYSLHLSGSAVDGTFRVRDPGDPQWRNIPCDEVASIALDSGLFGGIGWKKYGGRWIHLDIRPGPVQLW